MFVCLFKRQGSIPNESISIWNASLSLKHANKHSKINKQTNLFFVYSTLEKIAKMQNCKIRQKKMQVWMMPKTHRKSLSYFFTLSDECSAKGGTSAGTCASGFGVCCTCKFWCWFLNLKIGFFTCDTNWKSSLALCVNAAKAFFAKLCKKNLVIISPLKLYAQPFRYLGVNSQFHILFYALHRLLALCATFTP